jgi:hypothetical protein
MGLDYAPEEPGLPSQTSSVSVRVPPPAPEPESDVRLELVSVRFGEFLRESGAISDEELIAALADHWSNGGLIGAAVVRSGFLSRDEVERYASRFHNLDVVEI